jgi:hypothetical protein
MIHQFLRHKLLIFLTKIVGVSDEWVAELALTDNKQTEQLCYPTFPGNEEPFSDTATLEM